MKQMGKKKKSKGPSFLLDLASSSSKASIIGVVVELEAGVGEALNWKEEGLVAIEETWAEVSEALASILEPLMQVTRSAMKAMVAIAKVKWAATPPTGTAEAKRWDLPML